MPWCVAIVLLPLCCIHNRPELIYEANPHTPAFEEIKLGSETDLKPGSLET